MCNVDDISLDNSVGGLTVSFIPMTAASIVCKAEADLLKRDKYLTLTEASNINPKAHP